MTELTKQDIFIGSRVDVAFTLNTDSETAGFYDPGYVVVPELAAFPQLEVNTNIQELEVFDEDYTSRLSGNKNLAQSTLVVNEIPADPIQQVLKDAADNRTLVRFRNFYVIDTGESISNSQQGMYQIFDAYVSGYTRKGSSSSVAQIEYSLQPTGQILAQGVAETGELLRQGDYGVGAGVAGFPGPKDTLTLFGNSWRTYLGSSTDNPYSQDTTIIHSQPNESSAWQIIGSTRGTPDLRVRNLEHIGDGEISKSDWARVLTDKNLPTTEDINAVSKSGDTMSGDLRIFKPDATLRLNDVTITGKESNELTIASTSAKVQVTIDGKVTAPTVLISGTQDKAVNSATRKDYVDGEILKQVSKSGDTMTGQLVVQAGVRLPNNVAIEGLTTTGTPIKFASVGTDNKVAIGAISSNIVIQSSTNPAVKVGNNNYVMYHTGNIPTPQEVGAIPVGVTIDFGYF